MHHSQIASFIAHARSKGMDHQTIRMLLLSAGWKEKDIAQALTSESLDMTVPLPPDAGSARDAFFHLLSFTSLTATVVSLVILFFDYVSRLLPDPAFPLYAQSDVSGIRWALAVVFVSFPLFLWMSRLLHREFSLHPEKLASGVRRWLTYLTLFVTACTLIGDSIALIFSLLQGEITLRFFLKIVIILVLAGLPFSYYLYALRLPAERFTASPLHKRYLAVSALIVVVTIVWGFLIAGSPLRGRAERFDEQRLSDLRSIQSEIMNIALGIERNAMPPPTHVPHPLPATLEDVAQQATYQRLRVNDPETDVPYGYHVLSDHTFDLCARFALPWDQEFDIFWNHPAGEQCFSFDLFAGEGRKVPGVPPPARSVPVKPSLK